MCSNQTEYGKSLVFELDQKWNFLSYLWINVSNINSEIKKSFHVKNERLKFYRLSGATFCDCINTIYQFIKPFLDIKISIFEEYGAFKKQLQN